VENRLPDDDLLAWFVTETVFSPNQGVVMEISERHLSRIIQSAFRQLSADDIEDVLAEVRSAIFTAQSAGKVILNVHAYSCTVAKRRASVYARQKRRYVSAEADPLDDSEGWTVLDTLTADAGSGNCEDEIDVASVLREVPRHYATVLRRHYLEGEDFGLIASAEGVSDVCIRKRHERALKWARKRFKPRE